MHANPDADDGTDIITDGRKGKRELSTSKRAAQNRAAQVGDFDLHLLGGGGHGDVCDKNLKTSGAGRHKTLGDKDNSLLTYYYYREPSGSEKKATLRAWKRRFASTIL